MSLGIGDNREILAYFFICPPLLVLSKVKFGKPPLDNFSNGWYHWYPLYIKKIFFQNFSLFSKLKLFIVNKLIKL